MVYRGNAYKNIYIRGFDGPHSLGVVEIILAELKPDNCWFAYEPDHYPNRPPLRAPAGVGLHEISIRPLVAGDFSQVIKRVLPLDLETIEKMSVHETIVLRMAERMAEVGDIDHYRRRKWYYLEQLAAWNSFIRENKIDLFLMHDVPHHPTDYIPYALLREMGRPTLYFEKLPLPDAAYVTKHWVEAGSGIRARYEQLKSEFGTSTDGQLKVTLSAPYENSFRLLTTDARQLTYGHVESRKDRLRREKDFGAIVLRKASRVFLHSKAVLSRRIMKFFTLDFWYNRKHSIERETRRLLKYYGTLTAAPDMASKFIYFPLQYQPEGSTSPMCGAFNEMQLMIKIISAALPKDWKIYVKEYRGQTSVGRRTEFYDELLKLGNVQFVDIELPSLDLIKASQAVATGTGTAAWEALFQEKPVLLFGHPSFQFAPGLAHIRSLDDCQKAVKAILAGEHPSLPDLKLYLKAAEEVILPSYNEPCFEDDSALSHAQNVENLSTALLRELRRS